MGQKVSSLGDVFSWKNSDSSKNNDGPTAGARNSPRSSIPAAASVPVCAVHGVPVAGDQQHFENIYVSNSDGASSSGGDQSVNGCEAPATTSGVETVTSKNTQTSSTKSTAGSKKLNHWVLRFNCSRPKSKSTKYYNPNDYMPKGSNEEKNDETCVCTGYNRTEENEDEDDDENVDIDDLTDSLFDRSTLKQCELYFIDNY